MDYVKTIIPMTLIAVVIFSLAAIYLVDYFKKPKEQQIEDLEKFLRYLVYKAEELYGSKTGQLKLAYVYNLAVQQFPWIAYFMTYDEFNEKYVKAALDWLKEQVNNNEAIKVLLGTED